MTPLLLTNTFFFFGQLILYFGIIELAIVSLLTFIRRFLGVTKFRNKRSASANIKEKYEYYRVVLISWNERNLHGSCEVCIWERMILV